MPLDAPLYDIGRRWMTLNAARCTLGRRWVSLDGLLQVIGCCWTLLHVGGRCFMLSDMPLDVIGCVVRRALDVVARRCASLLDCDVANHDMMVDAIMRQDSQQPTLTTSFLYPKLTSNFLFLAA